MTTLRTPYIDALEDIFGSFESVRKFDFGTSGEPAHRSGDLETGHFQLPTNMWRMPDIRTLREDHYCLIDSKKIEDHWLADMLALDPIDAVLDYLSFKDFALKRETERVARKTMRQQAQDIRGAIPFIEAQVEPKVYVGKPASIPGAYFEFDQCELTSVTSADNINYLKDHGGVDGLSEMDKYSQKNLSTGLPKSWWQHVKEKSREVKTSQAHGTAQLTPVAATTPSTAPPPSNVSVLPQAFSPTAPPSPNPIPPTSTIPSPISIGHNSTPPPNPSGNSPPPNPNSFQGYIPKDKILRVYLLATNVTSTAAISSMQGVGTIEKKPIRSLILTANIFFAISFISALIGFVWICIRSWGNARNRNQDKYSLYIKISTVVAATVCMCLGIFTILAINIGRALM